MTRHSYHFEPAWCITWLIFLCLLLAMAAGISA